LSFIRHAIVGKTMLPGQAGYGVRAKMSWRLMALSQNIIMAYVILLRRSFVAGWLVEYCPTILPVNVMRNNTSDAYQPGHTVTAPLSAGEYATTSLPRLLPHARLRHVTITTDIICMAAAGGVANSPHRYRQLGRSHTARHRVSRPITGIHHGRSRQATVRTSTQAFTVTTST